MPFETFPTYPPVNAELVDRIVSKLKSQGIFDQFRKDCLADVDTKPAYQNLQQRVNGTVASFLATQTWQQDLNKTQLRESLRRHVQQGFLEVGVDRIVDQVVNPKIIPVFMPKVEDVVYDCLGIEKPQNQLPTTISTSYLTTAPPLPKTNPPPVKPTKPAIVDLLPKDLDPVSPESDNLSMTDGTPTKDERNNNESSQKFDEDSQLSGISDLSSHMGDSFRENPADSNTVKSITSPKGPPSDFQFDNFTNLSEKIRQAEMSHGQVTDPNIDIKKDDLDSSTTTDVMPNEDHEPSSKKVKHENSINDEAKLESISNNSLNTFEDSKNFISNKFAREDTFTSFSEDSLTSCGFGNRIKVIKNISKPSEYSENSNNSHKNITTTDQDEKSNGTKEQTIQKESSDSQIAGETVTKTDFKLCDENKDSKKSEDKDKKDRDSSASSKRSRSSDKHKSSDSKHRSSHDKKDEKDRKDDSKSSKDKLSCKDEKERTSKDERGRHKDDKYNSSRDRHKEKDKSNDRNKDNDNKKTKIEPKESSDKDKKTDKDYSDKEKISKDKYDKDKSSRSKHDRDKDRHDKEKREKDKSDKDKRDKDKADKEKHDREKCKSEKERDGQVKDREKEKEKSRHDKEKHEGRTKHEKDKENKNDKEKSRSSDDKKKDSKRQEKSSHSSSSSKKEDNHKNDEKDKKLKSSDSSRHKQNGEKSKSEEDKKDRKRKGERCNDEIKSKEARRSSDRDSSGGKGGSSHKASNSENRLGSSRESTGHSEKKTKSSNVDETTDCHDLHDQPSDVDGPSEVEKIITQLNSSIEESQHAYGEKELNYDDVPIKVPKIANNRFELGKIIKARRKFKNRKEGLDITLSTHETASPSSPQPIQDANTPEENKENIKAQGMEKVKLLKNTNNKAKFYGFQQTEIDKSFTNLVTYCEQLNFIRNSNDTGDIQKNSFLDIGTSEKMNFCKSNTLDDNEELLDNNLNNLKPKIKSLEKQETVCTTEKERSKSVKNIVNGKVGCYVLLSREECSEAEMRSQKEQSPHKKHKTSPAETPEKTEKPVDKSRTEEAFVEGVVNTERTSQSVADSNECPGASELERLASPERLCPQIAQPSFDSPIRTILSSYCDTVENVRPVTLEGIDAEAILDNLMKESSNLYEEEEEEIYSDDSDYEGRIKCKNLVSEAKEIPVPEPIQSTVIKNEEHENRSTSKVGQNSQIITQLLNDRVNVITSEKCVEVQNSKPFVPQNKDPGTPKEGSGEKVARRNQRLSRSSQRYESTDLYKPRPVLPQNSKRVRTSRSGLSEDSQKMKSDRSDSFSKRRGR